VFFLIYYSSVDIVSACRNQCGNNTLCSGQWDSQTVLNCACLNSSFVSPYDNGTNCVAISTTLSVSLPLTTSSTRAPMLTTLIPNPPTATTSTHASYSTTIADEIEPSTTSSRSTFVVIGVVASVGGLAVILFVTMVVRRNRRRQTHALSPETALQVMASTTGSMLLIKTTSPIGDGVVFSRLMMFHFLHSSHHVQASLTHSRLQASVSH
jgi:hypothetical protein